MVYNIRVKKKHGSEKIQDLIKFIQKWDYFQGHIDQTELAELGWEPNPLKIIKQDLALYIDSDNQIIEHNMKTALAKEKVDFLENVIRSLVNRGFNIKSAIDWEKFKVGI